MKSNGKVNGREQELSGEEQAKKIAKESKPGIETGGKILARNAAKQNERAVACNSEMETTIELKQFELIIKYWV